MTYANQTTPRGAWPAFGKRAFDVLVAAPALIVLAVPMALIAIAVKLTSHGPALFRQTRVGRDGQTFTLIKFRTMATGTADMPTHDVAPTALTPIGARLRRSKIDELPQLWNVLKGEMSLVGPRPCLPTQSVLVTARRARGVDRMRPGMTGLAQVMGIDMRDPERLARMDARYGRSITCRHDLALLLRTVLGGR